MFPSLDQAPDQKAIDDCNDLFVASNNTLYRLIADIKNQWRLFWDRDLTVEQMQARLDLLAVTPCVDDGITTSSLDAYFKKCTRWINNVLIEKADAFADSRTDITGNYHEYLGFGWLGTLDELTGRYIVTGPCEWMNEE